MFTKRPGLKWLIGSCVLIALGFAISFGLDTVVGVIPMFVGGIGTIGWRSDEDLKRGWPPWPFG